MHHDFIDKLSRLDSPVHRLPAGVKLAAAIGLIVATVLTPIHQWGYFVCVALFLLLVLGLSRLPVGFVFKKLLILEPFVLAIALLSLLQPGGGRVFAAMITKSTLSLFSVILLSSTTPFAAQLDVLRRIRLPAILVTTLALMYRYLFVLIDEAERMHMARVSRTFAPGRRRLWKTLATTVGQLFVRSTERAERIYAAMSARGWK